MPVFRLLTASSGGRAKVLGESSMQRFLRFLLVPLVIVAAMVVFSSTAEAKWGRGHGYRHHGGHHGSFFRGRGFYGHYGYRPYRSYYRGYGHGFHGYPYRYGYYRGYGYGGYRGYGGYGGHCHY